MNLWKFKIYPDCIYRIIRPRNLKWVADIGVAKWTFAVRFHAKNDPPDISHIEYGRLTALKLHLLEINIIIYYGKVEDGFGWFDKSFLIFR